MAHSQRHADMVSRQRQNADMVARLEDCNPTVRVKALLELAKKPATLARHADAVAARLEDSHLTVRGVALTTLKGLGQAALAACRRRGREARGFQCERSQVGSGNAWQLVA